MSGRDWPPPEKMVRIEWALILNVFHSVLPGGERSICQ